MRTDDRDSELESTFADVYRGPLDDFVRRRDASAKELRSAGSRASASIIKSLRKPSRMAWALDQAAMDSEGPATLVAAVAGTIEAHTVGGDVRTAMAQLRAAVRDFAGRAANAAELAGQRIDAGVLANAVLAVIGQPESFSQLQRGYLADIPEGGGLDFLAAMPAVAPTTKSSAPQPGQAQPSTPAPERAGLESSAREAVRQARMALTAARERAEEMQRTFRDAESKLHAAETRLRDAEHAVHAARSERERAHVEAEAAAAQLLDAENAVATTEHRLSAIP